MSSKKLTGILQYFTFDKGGLPMSADVDKLMRSILIQALTAKDLQTLILQLEAIAGEENVAIVMQKLSESKTL
jgi:hypothetical protein